MRDSFLGVQRGPPTGRDSLVVVWRFKGNNAAKDGTVDGAAPCLYKKKTIDNQKSPMDNQKSPMVMQRGPGGW